MISLIRASLSKFNSKPPARWGYSSNNHLDLGCGSNPRNPFEAIRLTGVDIVDSEKIGSNPGFNYVQSKVGASLPFDDETFDTISGFDFIEHLSREPNSNGNNFIFLMSECHRILRPGGKALFVTPAFPSPSAFQDPTHVNIITSSTINYFIGESAPARTMGYGFTGNFTLLYQGWVTPNSQVFKKLDSLPTKGILGFQNVKNIADVRRVISGFRKPTHLIWVIEKPRT